MTEPSDVSESMPEDSSSMPSEAPKKRPIGKILAVVVVLVLIIAAIAIVYLPAPPGAQEIAPDLTRVDITSGTTGSIGSVGVAIAFRATATGTIGNYTWNFGDNSTAVTTGNTTSHTYAGDGIFLVLVTVTSPLGRTDTNDGSLVQLTILDAAFAPSDGDARAIAAVNPTVTTLAAATVTANGSASHGFINCTPNPPVCEADTSLAHTHAWDWGDGQTTANASDTTHTYAAQGHFAVRLTVTVIGGDQDSYWVTVRVAPVVQSLVKNPGVLVIASIGDPQYLDPAVDYETAGNEIIKSVYDRLVTRQVDATNPLAPVINNAVFVGQAASSWTVSTDQLTWNFTIRGGMRWHDSAFGTLSASDVEFSLRRALLINIGPTWIIDQYLTDFASDDPLTLGTDERWDAINASVVATDATHVELRLAAPYGAVLQTLDYQVASIVSRAWVNAHGGVQQDTLSAYANRNMMGTGPFILDHWTPGVELKLVRNANYWGTVQPRIAAVLQRLVPESATQELLLRNGDVDWADGIPTADINTVKTWAGVLVEENPSLVIQYMGMVQDNSWPGDPARTMNTSPMQDIHVRKAVALAFDYQTVQQQILDGWATQLRSPIPNGMPGYDGSFWTYSTNITAAQAELAMAAPPWNAGGFTINLSYNSGNPVRSAIAPMVQAQLALLGINVVLQGVTFPQHLDNMDFRRSELFLIGWAPDYLDPDDYLYPLFHSSACSMPAGGNPLVSTAGTNAACYNNPLVDAAIDNARATSVWSARLENYTIAQQLIVEDSAWVFNYQPTALDPIRDWVKGYFFDPMELRDFLYLFK